MKRNRDCVRIKPFTEAEIKAAFKKDQEWEAFESAMTNVPASPPEGGMPERSGAKPFSRNGQSGAETANYSDHEQS
jgi:hypothetical protein